MTRTWAALSALTLAACGHVPDRPQFHFERTGPEARQCPTPVTAPAGDANEDTPSTAPQHLLWSQYCEVMGFADDYLEEARTHSRFVDLKNIVTFGAAAYGASTLALNSGGLSDVETTDLRETTLGIALLQATNQIYSPVGSRDTNLRAYFTYECVADTTYLVLERETFVRRVEDELLGAGGLRESVAELEGKVAARAIPNDALAEQARATIATATAEIERATSQVNAYYNFPAAVVNVRNEIYNNIVLRSVRSELGFAALVQAIGATVEENMAFANKDEPPASTTEPPAGAPGVMSADDQARTLINRISRQVSEIQRITPNITTLSANLSQCATIMSTGLRVSRPTLQDIGAGPLPDTGNEFFSEYRRTQQ
jgi:hypothetical protein